MNISFIVLTYNRPDALLAVLRSLAGQCRPADQIIVADDGSRVESVRMLKEQAPRFACQALHVWHEDRGFTASAARNRAALHASGQYLVFLDGDCVPGPAFAQSHRGLAETGCFVNGSRVLLKRELTESVLSDQTHLAEMPASFWLRAWVRGQANKVHHLVPWPLSWRGSHSEFSWRGIRSCNFGLWREDFLAVNGFDQVYQGWGHEDADLVLRLHHSGLSRKNGFMATEVFHLWHPESPRLHEQINRSRVVERLTLGTVRAESGLAELVASEGTVTPL
jgi:glycosyltransferase involved in cell wall biosynthesis